MSDNSSPDMGLRVGDTQPKAFGTYPGVSQALRDGAHLHGFRSGGGLRVLRLEKPQHGKLLGYGEHPYIEQAFDYLEEDVREGPRRYEDVYGPVHEHYLTGSSAPSGEVDRWVLSGRDFDITADGVVFKFTSQYGVNAVPKEVSDRVMATRKAERHTDHRGFVFEITPFVCPGNGKLGCSHKVVETPAGHESVFSYEYSVPVKLVAETLEGLLASMEVKFRDTWERR